MGARTSKRCCGISTRDDRFNWRRDWKLWKDVTLNYTAKTNTMKNHEQKAWLQNSENAGYKGKAMKGKQKVQETITILRNWLFKIKPDLCILNVARWSLPQLKLSFKAQQATVCLWFPYVGMKRRQLGWGRTWRTILLDRTGAGVWIPKPAIDALSTKWRTSVGLLTSSPDGTVMVMCREKLVIV